MAGYMLLAFLGAAGLLSVCWAAFGWLLPQCREGWILCPGKPGKLAIVPVYLWLRSMGILKCPLILLDLGLEEGQRRALAHRGIEICAVTELNVRLGIGAEEI